MNIDYRWLEDVLGLSIIPLLNAAVRFDIEALGLGKDVAFERREDCAIAGRLLLVFILSPRRQPLLRASLIRVIDEIAV
jgi:hypothetical protein